MKKVSILGATGSVGSQALEIVRAFPGELDVVCLTAHEDIDGLAAAAQEFKPEAVAITGHADAQKLKSMLPDSIALLDGDNALIDAVTTVQADLIVLAVLGIAGLPAFFASLEHKIPVALANKESLVCGADIARRKIEETGTRVLPVDSEHSGIFQCLGNSYDVTDVNRIWITASGGPFLHATKEEIDRAPLEKALKHPNWAMGNKITIDSASLANKGLEVIEAHYMYSMPADRIKVVVHPQSLIHAMVEMIDSSVTAQIGPVDMRLPLQKAMLYPKMFEFSMNKPLNFLEIGTIELIPPDLERFPCLGLAYDSIKDDCTAAYNIANEAAVALYMERAIEFGDISKVIANSMEKYVGNHPASLDEVMALDREIRAYVRGKYGC